MIKGFLSDSYINYYSWFVAVLLSVLIGLLFFCFIHYVHESGHITIGFLYYLSTGRVIIPRVTNYMNCVMIPVPQRTSNLPEYTDCSLVAYCGSIFTIIFTILLIIYLRGKLALKKLNYLPLLLLVIYYEFVGNFLMGTDNWTNKPLITTNQLIGNLLNFFIKNMPYLIMISTALLLSNPIKTYLMKKLKRLFKQELLIKQSRLH